MLEYIIPILEYYCSSGILSYTFYPVFCLAVLATIPCIIRALVRSR